MLCRAFEGKLLHEKLKNRFHVTLCFSNIILKSNRSSSKILPWLLRFVLYLTKRTLWPRRAEMLIWDWTDFWHLTCSSLTQEQCQYERPAHLTKNSLSGRPLSGGLVSGSVGLPSGPVGGSAGSGASPHVQCIIFCTFPLRGGHCKEKVRFCHTHSSS